MKEHIIKIYDYLRSHTVVSVELFLLVIVTLLFLVISCEKSALKSKFEHNMVALNDSITYLNTQRGKQLAIIKGYEADLRDLKLYSENLYAIVEDYKNTIGNKPTGVVSTSSVTVLPPVDTIFVIVNNDSVICNTFDFSDKYRELTGTVCISDTIVSVSIDPESIFMSLCTGIDEKNEVFVMVDNPYVHITSLEGFIVPKPKIKRWGLGVQAGYGLDMMSFRGSPYIGIGISYNFITF